MNLKFLAVISTFFIYTDAYGYKMHKFLGGLTDKYFSLNEPTIYKEIIGLLDGNIDSISSWADQVKRTKKYMWTSKLHYIDIMECRVDNYPTDIIDSYCQNNCIVSAIADLTNSLKYNNGFIYKLNNITLTRSEQLKFLIHFIQDFNQPLHLLGYDRGGNSFKVNMYKDGHNKTSNLHYIWDSLLPEHFVDHYGPEFEPQCRTLPTNVALNVTDVLNNVLNDNIKKVSCKIYPDSHYIIFDEYFKKEYFVLLFDNYHKLVTSLLLHIFQ